MFAKEGQSSVKIMNSVIAILRYEILLALFAFLIMGLDYCRCWEDDHRDRASPRVVEIKYGILRGIILEGSGVEAFLGVPYAHPPLNQLRFMPPMTPNGWTGEKFADKFSPVCPQTLPNISNRTEALMEIPRRRLIYLEKVLPLLADQSEDCLYLNVYVPGGGINIGDRRYPILLFIHGEDWLWDSGNLYDVSMLARHGKMIVVTFNYRLGIFGFFRTEKESSQQGNHGFMDIIAALHWLQENGEFFGGNASSVTVMGYGTGAALANLLALSFRSRGLMKGVILLGGSALSPWAIQRDTMILKRKVAERTGCHGDLLEDDLGPCLRQKTAQELTSLHLKPPRFTPSFAPFLDAGNFASLAAAFVTDEDRYITPNIWDLIQRKGVGPGYEFANFPNVSLMAGFTNMESYAEFSAQDLEFGVNESKRDRYLRTFVRNSYVFHLREIFSALRNEYTQWEKSVHHPIHIRDTIGAILSDGLIAAGILKVCFLHALTNGLTYVFHFPHTPSPLEFNQKNGSVHGEYLPFIFGHPLYGKPDMFNKNYTNRDVEISKQMIYHLSNFAKYGDPNGVSGRYFEDMKVPQWTLYNATTQEYMEIGTEESIIGNHYRGHKMSMWLNLIPQLHHPGPEDVLIQHHHFIEDKPEYYAGVVRAKLLRRPYFPTTTVPVPTSRSRPGKGMPTTKPAATQLGKKTMKKLGKKFGWKETTTRRAIPTVTSTNAGKQYLMIYSDENILRYGAFIAIGLLCTIGNIILCYKMYKNPHVPLRTLIWGCCMRDTEEAAARKVEETMGSEDEGPFPTCHSERCRSARRSNFSEVFELEGTSKVANIEAAISADAFARNQGNSTANENVSRQICASIGVPHADAEIQCEASDIKRSTAALMVDFTDRVPEPRSGFGDMKVTCRTPENLLRQKPLKGILKKGAKYEMSF